MKTLKKQTLILLSIASLLLVGLAVLHISTKRRKNQATPTLIARPVLVRCVPFSRNIWTRGVWITLSIWLGITMIPWVLLDYLGILHHLPKQTMMWKNQ